MKISVIAKGMKDQFGRMPLQIRIANGDDRRFIPLHIKVVVNKDDPTVNEWDQATGQVTKVNPFYKDLNRRIRLRVAQVENGMEDEPEEVKITFKAYALQCFNSWEKELAWNTMRCYFSDLNNVATFDADLLLKDVTPTWCTKYRAHLFGRDNAANSVHDAFKFIKKIMLQAKTEGLVEENPFDKFKMPAYKHPKRVHLSTEQVNAVIAVAKDEHHKKEVRTAAAWFAIGCFTGLAYADMCAFSKGWIKDGIIYYAREKNDNPVSLPLEPEVMELLEIVEYKALAIQNQPFNRMLKIVAGFARIRENLTAHVARHTFATNMLSAGAGVAFVSRLLGHRKLTTTQIYAQVTDLAMHEQYRLLFKKMREN